MDTRLLIEDIHKNIKEKGFWENPNVGEKLMLVVSELGEALEADRNDQHFSYMQTHIETIRNIESDELFKREFEKRVKDTFEDELADALIRLFDLSRFFEIDIMAHIEAKHRYNKMRPYKHDKAY